MFTIYWYGYHHISCSRTFALEWESLDLHSVFIVYIPANCPQETVKEIALTNIYSSFRLQCFKNLIQESRSVYAIKWEEKKWSNFYFGTKNFAI